jgi:acid phosphatase family membrane protein YuiD
VKASDRYPSGKLSQAVCNKVAAELRKARKSLDLTTATFAIQTPCAKALAVVGHQPVAVFAKTLIGAAYCVCACIARVGRQLGPHREAAGELIA